HAGQDCEVVDARRRGVRRRNPAHGNRQDPETHVKATIQGLSIADRTSCGVKISLCCSACREAGNRDLRSCSCRVRIPTKKIRQTEDYLQQHFDSVSRSIVLLNASEWGHATSFAVSRPRPAAGPVPIYRRSEY